MAVIAVKSFKGKNKFLSNFYKCDVEYEGIIYPTAEHAFQAAKTFDINERKTILLTKNPLRAKIMGRKVTLRSDWEEVKVDIMTEILRKKFQDPKLKKLVAETGKNEIVEGNTWHDKYWGKCTCEHCQGVGENHLGIIIEKIRSELFSN